MRPPLPHVVSPGLTQCMLERSPCALARTRASVALLSLQAQPSAPDQEIQAVSLQSNSASKGDMIVVYACKPGKVVLPILRGWPFALFIRISYWVSASLLGWVSVFLMDIGFSAAFEPLPGWVAALYWAANFSTCLLCIALLCAVPCAALLSCSCTIIDYPICQCSELHSRSRQVRMRIWRVISCRALWCWRCSVLFQSPSMGRASCPACCNWHSCPSSQLHLLEYA